MPLKLVIVMEDSITHNRETKKRSMSNKYSTAVFAAIAFLLALGCGGKNYSDVTVDNWGEYEANESEALPAEVYSVSDAPATGSMASSSAGTGETSA